MERVMSIKFETVMLIGLSIVLFISLVANYERAKELSVLRMKAVYNGHAEWGFDDFGYKTLIWKKKGPE